MKNINVSAEQANKAYSENDLESAYDLCASILSHTPKSHLALYIMGLIHRDKNFYNKAIELIEASIAVKPNNLVYSL